ncbi:Ger(x)C family spore germination protein [Paenibacillus aestuarii]|uniref:Ger(X)C family spore germination protein n=1 Tax=Paenibacillus aestuarii TaxID=516965 RepID=A0ABW0K170_9BACL|nr:Ger(x)C family spore germination protein [Paenibacillus aestuarii]
MKRWLCLFMTFLLLLLTTSCYGLRQINELAIVTAVGLDVGKTPGSVKLSVQIIRPADARGQTGAPAGGTGQPIYSISAEGDSIFDAIRNLGHFTSRRVYWAHNFLIVMHESYARRGIADMIDFFTRNHELRMNTWVAVSPDPPDEVISTITGLEVVPGQAVDRLFRNIQIVGIAPASDMRSLEEAYLSRSVEPVLAKVQLVKRGISNKKPEEHGSIKQVELAGAAVFYDDDKMIGWLSTIETKGTMYFLQKQKSGIEVVACPGSKDQRVTLELKDIRLKVTPSYANQTPRFDIRMITHADVVENNCEASMRDIREATERTLRDKLTSDIEQAVAKAKQYHSDFLKLSDVFRNKFPMEWQTLGTDWNDIFAKAETSIEVEATIKSTVLKTAKQEVK